MSTQTHDPFEAEIDKWKTLVKTTSEEGSLVPVMDLGRNYEESIISPGHIPKRLVRKGFKYKLKEKIEGDKDCYVYRCADYKKLKCRGMYKIYVRKGRIKERMSKAHNLYQNYHTFSIKKNKKRNKKALKYKSEETPYNMNQLSPTVTNPLYLKPDPKPEEAPKIEKEVVQTICVKDPFIFLREGEEATKLDTDQDGQFDIEFRNDKDVNEYDFDTASTPFSDNQELYQKNKEEMEKEQIINQGFKTPELILTSSGEKFGRKHEEITITTEEGSVNVKLTYFLSERMIKVLMDNTEHSQIFCFCTTRISSATEDEEQSYLMTLLIFDKNISNFTPAIFCYVEGLIVNDTFHAMLRFMEEQFPNTFKPTKIIMEECTPIELVDKRIQANSCLYDVSKSIWQLIADSLLCSEEEILREDIPVLALLMKSLLLWGDVEKIDEIIDTFSESSIDKKGLKRLALNFKNKFLSDVCMYVRHEFLDQKCFELFKESERSKENYHCTASLFFPGKGEYLDNQIISNIIKLEQEYDTQYQNSLDPILCYQKPFPWWQIHKHVLRIYRQQGQSQCYKDDYSCRFDFRRASLRPKLLC
ncbi:unnamed protein product [Moneuplotes crassus]|uniref:Uncharacterized protein n=1 Tax=Euplotes crassus TaxID=5936 RepID=A0AAD1U394_EUPCR|nr:unnamed protein product [Moneuplotes crassus]